jgi:hypothetical protein
MGHAGIRIGWRAAEGEGEMMLRSRINKKNRHSA